MQPSTETSLAQPSAIQRFPPELVYPIVLQLFAEQLEDVVFGPDAPEADDSFPTLSLLHLCNVFRRCTTEVLTHMLAIRDSGTRCVPARVLHIRNSAQSSL